MKTILAIAFLFILLAFSALADITVTDVKLGSDSQQRGENVSSIITITNTGSASVQNLAVSFQGVDARYKTGSALSATSIGPGSSVTVTVTGFIPMDFDAVNSEGKKVSFDIGDVAISGSSSTGAVSKTVNLFMEAENNLEFSTQSELKIGTSAKSLRDNKDFSDVKRGDDIEVTIVAKNSFSDSGDCEDESRNCDIDNIDAKIESQDSDIDVDEDLSFGSIGADNDDSDSVSFSVPDDISDANYDIDLWMTGEDENGALHGDSWTFTLEVNVISDQVDITSFDLFPDTLSCNNRRTTLSVTLKNTGSSDQDEVSIFIDSSKLDIKDSVYNIVVDESETVTRTFDLTVPGDLNPGTYFIQIVANVNSDEETDRQSANLIVESCDKPGVPVNPGTNTTQPPVNTGNTEVKVVEVPPTSGVIYGKPKQESTSAMSAWFIAALFAIAILLFVILVVVLLRK